MYNHKETDCFFTVLLIFHCIIFSFNKKSEISTPEAINYLQLV